MIGKNIAALRKKHRLTQIEFAQKVHVTQGAVSQWETGRTNPDTYQLIQIANLFDVDISDLTGKAPEQSAVTFQGVIRTGDVPEPVQTRSMIAEMNTEAIRSKMRYDIDTLLQRLSPDRLQQALDYMKFLEQQEEK